MTFSGTTQINKDITPETINKAILDLLGKINSLDIAQIVTDQTYGTYRNYPDGSTQGRELTASTTRSNAAALTNNTALTIASISIPAGMNAEISGAGGILTTNLTSVTGVIVAISKKTNAIPSVDTHAVPTNGEVFMELDYAAMVPGANGDINICLPPYRFNNTTSVPVTLYLIVRAGFTVAGAFGYGSIRAMSVL